MFAIIMNITLKDRWRILQRYYNDHHHLQRQHITHDHQHHFEEYKSQHIDCHDNHQLSSFDTYLISYLVSNLVR